MTLPALLSKLSVRTPRYVTVQGRTIPDDDVSVVDGLHYHPQHGHVTPVRPHTNHGGELPKEGKNSPWWSAQPGTLQAEADAMSRAFPGFVQTEVDGRPAWRGNLDTGRGTFGVTIVHRPDHGLPRVIPDRPHRFRRRAGRRLRPSPHLYVNGDLCIAGQSDWNPVEDDATTVVAWTAHWLASFTEWWISGLWPCEGTTADA